MGPDSTDGPARGPTVQSPRGVPNFVCRTAPRSLRRRLAPVTSDVPAGAAALLLRRCWRWRLLERADALALLGPALVVVDPAPAASTPIGPLLLAGRRRWRQAPALLADIDRPEALGPIAFEFERPRTAARCCSRTACTPSTPCSRCASWRTPPTPLVASCGGVTMRPMATGDSAAGARARVAVLDRVVRRRGASHQPVRRAARRPPAGAAERDAADRGARRGPPRSASSTRPDAPGRRARTRLPWSAPSNGVSTRPCCRSTPLAPWYRHNLLSRVGHPRRAGGTGARRTPHGAGVGSRRLDDARLQTSMGDLWIWRAGRRCARPRAASRRRWGRVEMQKTVPLTGSA